MRLFLLVLLLALAPALAQAQETPPEGDEASADANATPTDATPADAGPQTVEIVLEGTDEGGFAFYLEGNPQKNPTITVAPGAQVTIRLKSTGGFHNIQVQGEKPSDYVDTGEETVYTFTAPSEPGRLQYWCVPHRGSGMVGTIQIGTAQAPSGGGGGDAGDIAGGEIVGETVEVPGCPGAKVPAAVAQGVAGGPTMADYQAKCAAGSSTSSGPAEPEESGADYVLPVSFGLIGLGILAVIWVHKSYKP